MTAPLRGKCTVENARQGTAVYSAASFRDPRSRVFESRGTIYRALDAEAFRAFSALSETAFYRRRTSDGSIVRTCLVSPESAPLAPESERWETFLEHERIPFVSYSYEWCFGMLQDAALLQLALLREARTEGLTVRDATPFNIQWRGVMPCFIDIPSFGVLRPNEPWAAYGQFCRTFLYPLMLQSYKGASFHPILRGSLEGIEPDWMRNIMGFRDLFRSGIFADVVMLSWFERKYGTQKVDARSKLDSAGFSSELVTRNIERLEKVVSKLRWKEAGYSMQGYFDALPSYSAGEFEQKKAFVSKVVSSSRSREVWDIGCNTGEFSLIAAESAESVIALDRDHASIERLYRRLKQNGPRNILPLVMDISDPSPSRGWNFSERAELRSRGRPDLIFALALMHHLVISANIRMEMFIEFLATFEADVIVEFVGAEDPMSKLLLQNKPEVHSEYTREEFERILETHFAVRETLMLPGGHRTLYSAAYRNARQWEV